jgi:uncharacterized protein (DUF1501 family)
MDEPRRFFLKSSGLALLSFAVAPSFLKRTALAQALTASDKDRPILIAIFQRGAADGLSMVVPFGDRHYYGARPQIALPEPQRGNLETTIDLDGFFALHPALAPLKPMYDAGHLAIIDAVGSPHNTRSHFDAQDYMESGTPGVKNTADGWLNRHMQTKNNPQASPFRAVAFGPVLPRTLMGRAPAIAMTDIAAFGVHGGQDNAQLAQGFEALYTQTHADILQGTGKEAFEAVKWLKKVNPQRYQPSNGADYPRTPYGRALLQTAQLIKADIGLEVAFIDIGGWDTHANQGSAQGQLANRLREFGAGLVALHLDLGDRMQKVVVLTMTEFGRMLSQNGSGGTDHGHASCLFVLGGPVKGGKVHGKWPGLAPEQLYEGRDLALTTDFRDVFAEVVTHHLGAPNLRVIFPGFRPNPANFLGFIRT